MYKDIMIGLLEAIIMERKSEKITPLEIYDQIQMELQLKLTKEEEEEIREQIRKDFLNDTS